MWRVRSRFNPHPPVGAGATGAIARYRHSGQRFQSSPARGGGCNAQVCVIGQVPNDVSILTRPWGRVQLGMPDIFMEVYRFVSILTRPWGRVQRPTACPACPPEHVSILTRPWGRVQLARAELMLQRMIVSILTRPWGRVQRGVGVLRDESRVVSILTRPWGRVQLNDSRVRA